MTVKLRDSAQGEQFIRQLEIRQFPQKERRIASAGDAPDFLSRKFCFHAADQFPHRSDRGAVRAEVDGINRIVAGKGRNRCGQVGERQFCRVIIQRFAQNAPSGEDCAAAHPPFRIDEFQIDRRSEVHAKRGQGTGEDQGSGVCQPVCPQRFGMFHPREIDGTARHPGADDECARLPELLFEGRDDGRRRHCSGGETVNPEFRGGNRFKQTQRNAGELRNLNVRVSGVEQTAGIHPGQPPSFSMMLISGMNRAITIPPTTTARNTIINGSIIDVSAPTALSTSSS